jgi:hypothetical protein
MPHGDGKPRSMTSIAAPSVPLSRVGRAAHDLGLAGLLGGNLFGRLALHPSVTEISDQEERGKVINAAWRRYGTVNSLSLLAVASGWAGARAAEARDHRLSPEERRLARAKDVLVGVVAVTGVATAVEGVRFARSAPNGAVPMRDGDHAAVNATPESARRKRRLNVLGTAGLAAEVALVGVNAALGQENFRRPPARRFLIRR